MAQLSYDILCVSSVIRYHGGGVCPTRTTGPVYEETASSTRHSMEVPGGQAAGLCSQLLGKRGEHARTNYRM